MRLSVLRNCKLGLARGAAALVLGGLAAGCSSGSARFTDGLMTASTTSNQQQAISRSEPDLVAPQAEETYSISDSRSAAPAPRSVQRSSLPPVAGTTTSSEPFRRASSEDVEQPVRTAALTKPSRPSMGDEESTSRIDPLSRAVERGAGRETAEVERKDPAGWSSAGGSQITAKEGETVFNLSRRYGVPSDVLMKVNDIDESGSLRAGQKVRIPVYVYSDKNPVSAPDNNPRVANSKSSRGMVEPATAEPTSSAGTKQKARNGTYVVESGDSLLGIARDNGTTMAALRNANGMENNDVRIGQTLKIPGAGAASVAELKPKKLDGSKAAKADADTVKKATAKAEEAEPAKKQLAVATKADTTESAKPAAYTPPANKAVAQAEADDDSAAPSGTGIGKMRWPVKGRVVAGYGKGSGNAKDGIDIQVPEGTSVKAAENGVVIYAGNGLKDFGNTVLVRHDNGLVTVYGNASALNVKRGQKVKRGEQIATSGMSGAAQSPKLHFEVRKDAAPVDPSTYLE